MKARGTAYGVKEVGKTEDSSRIPYCAKTREFGKENVDLWDLALIFAPFLSPFLTQLTISFLDLDCA